MMSYAKEFDRFGHLDLPSDSVHVLSEFGQVFKLFVFDNLLIKSLAATYCFIFRYNGHCYFVDWFVCIDSISYRST